MKRQIPLNIWAIGILFFISLLAADTALAHEGFWDSNLPPAAQKAWQSTIQIRFIRITEIQDSKRKVKVGAGIILDLDPERQEALIVTTNHCLKGQKNRLYRYEIKFPGKPGKEPGKETYYLARKAAIVLIQPGKDLVYLSVQYPPQSHPTVAPLRAVDNDGTHSKDLISIGFPCLYLRQKKNWNPARPKNYKKIIKRFSRGNVLAKGLSGNQVYVLAHNADMLSGNCGGPLVDQDGSVVGINSRVFRRTAKGANDRSMYDYLPGSPDCYYVAVSISEVLKDLKFIKKNNLW